MGYVCLPDPVINSNSILLPHIFNIITLDQLYNHFVRAFELPQKKFQKFQLNFNKSKKNPLNITNLEIPNAI